MDKETLARALATRARYEAQSKGKTKVCGVRLPEELLEAIDALAREAGRTRNALIRDALYRLLEDSAAGRGE